MLGKKLFRGKNAQGVWVYGSLIEDHTTGNCYILESNAEATNQILINDAGEHIRGRIIPVDKKTVSQYIWPSRSRRYYFYEGDIVKTSPMHLPISRPLTTAVIIDSNTIIQKGLGVIFPQDTLYYEIIGNIFDNPDLLDEETAIWVKNYWKGIA